jgi:hypothetical protein
VHVVAVRALLLVYFANGAMYILEGDYIEVRSMVGT